MLKRLKKDLYEIELFIASTNNLFATDLIEESSDRHFEIDASDELQAIWRVQRILKAVELFAYVFAVVFAVGVLVWVF